MEEETLIYKIKCPKCAAKAEAVMMKGRIKGTYREPTANFVATRIQCEQCGLVRDRNNDAALAYELWYKTDFKGNTLWAVNERHIDFLINWLSGKMNKNDLSYFERTYAEILPKWLIINKEKAVVRLKKLKEKG